MHDDARHRASRADGRAARTPRAGRRRRAHAPARRARLPAPRDHRRRRRRAAARPTRTATCSSCATARSTTTPPSGTPDGPRPPLPDAQRRRGAPAPLRGARPRLRGRARRHVRLRLWDARAGRLVLARDRLGEKPLYYAVAERQPSVRVGAEGAPRDRPRRREPTGRRSPRTSAPATCRAGERVCRGSPSCRRAAGWCSRARASASIATGRWRRCCAAPALALEPADAAAASCAPSLDARGRAALMSDVPLGVFLSGGLDSTAVAALARPHVDGARDLRARLRRARLRRARLRRARGARARHAPSHPHDHAGALPRGRADARAVCSTSRSPIRRSCRPFCSPAWRART